MYDDDSRITDLAHFFQAQGRQRDLRANDPEAFVRLIYIAKSALDRQLGAGNRHSAGLVHLCDSVETAATPPKSSALSERYRMAALIMRAVVLESIERSPSSDGPAAGLFR